MSQQRIGVAVRGDRVNDILEMIVRAEEATRVAVHIEAMLSIGATELLASPVVAGADRAGLLDRTRRLLGQVATSRVS